MQNRPRKGDKMALPAITVHWPRGYYTVGRTEFGQWVAIMHGGDVDGMMILARTRNEAVAEAKIIGFKHGLKNTLTHAAYASEALQRHGYPVV